MRAIPRIKTRTRRFIVRRIARSVWDLANAAPYLPAAGVLVAVALLYVINK